MRLRPSQQLYGNLMRELQPEAPSRAEPRFHPDRNYMKVCCFKPLYFGIIVILQQITNTDLIWLLCLFSFFNFEESHEHFFITLMF